MPEELEIWNSIRARVGVALVQLDTVLIEIEENGATGSYVWKKLRTAKRYIQDIREDPQSPLYWRKLVKEEEG